MSDKQIVDKIPNLKKQLTSIILWALCEGKIYFLALSTRVFGSPAYSLIPEHKRDKLDEKLVIL